jgi:adenylate cyclase class IV
MREVEVKGVIDDLARRRAMIELAGARLVFAGRLEDRRYDTPERELAQRDQVLRVRVYRDGSGSRTELDWKGPTGYEDGYKVREELTVSSAGGDDPGDVLERIGYVVTRAIDRKVTQYELDGAVIRFEEYPRMDILAEVEGAPDAIEGAIRALGMPRETFTSERLPDFVARFESRTGKRAALCDGELAGTVHYDVRDA